MELRRRSFLTTLLLGLAAFVGGAPGRWLAAWAQSAPADAAQLSSASRRLLGHFADVIVPKWNDHPAASAGDFVARFEALARQTPGRDDTYRRWFERFATAVGARVPLSPGPPDAPALHALFEAWHREWRTQPSPSFEAQFFEMLRRDVMRTFYASPAGWKAAGFAGPVHRATPDGRPHA
jgi:hypothetical protein